MLINTCDLATNDRSNCVARTLTSFALESRARADRYDAAFRRRYFRSRSMRRNNGCKVRLFWIPRALFYDFYSVTCYDEVPHVSANMTDFNSIDPARQSTRDTMDVCISGTMIHVVYYCTIIRGSERFLRWTNATSIRIPRIRPKWIPRRGGHRRCCNVVKCFRAT